MGHPDVSTNLHKRAQNNPVLPANSGQLPRHDAAAVNGLIQLSAQPTLPVAIPPSALHMLPEDIIIDNILPHLSFKEAMNLEDKRLTEEDIITHCDKSKAEEIIAYIFRDLGSSDHGITDEVRLKNFRILLNSEQVQRKIRQDNSAAFIRRHSLITMVESGELQMLPHLRDNVARRYERQLTKWRILYPNGDPAQRLVLDSLQKAVNGLAQNGKISLLRRLLQRYKVVFSQVNIPFEAISMAAENGDKRAVVLILRNVVEKSGRASHRSNTFHFDEYVHHALKGSVLGENFGMFKRLIPLYNRNSSFRLFPDLILRDLLNKNLSSWVAYAITKCNYMFDRTKALQLYVKRSDLKNGNPIRPTVENLHYLMHLPDNIRISIKSFISIMRYADFDIQEHLARQLLDPDLHFRVREHVTIGSKRRIVEKHVSGLEALNYAIDMANSYKTNTYNHVRAALEKVKGEFDPFAMRDLETNQEANADLSDFFENTILLS
jgi:hypothetical protein